MKFTGHERDLASTAGAGDDLDYMHARHYSPVVERFTSTDSIAGKTTKPQSFNRYAYVLNDSLTQVDPNGKCAWDLCIGEGIAATAVIELVASAAVTTYVISRIHDAFSQPSVVENSTPKDKPAPNVYTPDRDLPRDKVSGNAIPETDSAHTQLGRRTSKQRGERYPQAREFDSNGKPVRDVDFTDHGRPEEHTNPHEHNYDPKTGKRGPNKPLDPPGTSGNP